MRLKKRTNRYIQDKNSLYNLNWQKWLDLGIKNSEENRLIWLKNKGKDGNWVLDLLLTSINEDAEVKTEIQTVSEEFTKQNELSELKILLTEQYNELDDSLTEYEILTILKRKFEEQDKKYNEVMGG